jgi:hypothetical protein
MMENENGELPGDKEFDVSVNIFCWGLSCPFCLGAVPYRKFFDDLCHIYYMLSSLNLTFTQKC